MAEFFNGGFVMKRQSVYKLVAHLLIAIVLAASTGISAYGQNPGQSSSAQALPAAKTDQAQAVASAETDDQYFKGIYRHFYDTYRLGPEDELAIRVLKQPDYSLERVKVSPTGHIHYPLIGDIEVAGLTVTKLREHLAASLSEYIIDPNVSVSLIEAKSAKIGVLGEVANPGIMLMAKPMTVIDAITASGGVTNYGNQSSVTLLRQMGDSRVVTTKVNVKRILEGKARPEDNVTLRAGDTLIVHGNTKKKIAFIASLTGFGNFLAFLVARK